MNALLTLWCRLFHRARPVDGPASRDLVKEMRHQGRKAEAETSEFRRKYDDYFFPRAAREKRGGDAK